MLENKNDSVINYWIILIIKAFKLITNNLLLLLILNELAMFPITSLSYQHVHHIMISSYCCLRNED